MKILILTTVGRTPEGHYIDIFPSRWSTINRFKCMTYYPYEQAYLSVLLKKYLIQQNANNDTGVKMIDGNIKGWTIDQYTDVIINEDPDWIVLETCQLAYNVNISLIKRVKEHKPEIKVLMCGAYPTAFPEHVLNDGIDTIAIGEFEWSILDFFSKLINTGPHSSAINDNTIIPGIYPTHRRELLDINQLPFPEDQDISRRDYCRILACEYNELEVFATRGCVNMCNFCVAGNIYYGKPNYRTREIDQIINEIQYLTEKYPDVTGIFFNEENHTLNNKFNFSLIDAIMANGLNHLKYECMSNFSTLTEDLLIAMKKAGYYKIRIGIETLDEENSKKIFRTKNKINKDKLYNVLTLCRRIGIKIYGTVTVGSLGSSYDTDSYTIKNIENLWKKKLLQDFQVSICTPMAGTPFYEQTYKEGLLLTNNGSDYDGNVSSIVNYPHYSNEKINENFKRAHQLMQYMMEENQKQGIRYSMYDQQWCKHIYDLEN